MADSPNTTPMTEISRQVVEAEIDMLIDLLDKLDSDPDAEPDDDNEPWLGAAEGWQFTNWRHFENPNHDDRESEDCDLEDGHDAEPELGWTAVEAKTGRYPFSWCPDAEPSLASTCSLNQTYWWMGRSDDLEDEHDGREDDPDFEPQCEDEGAQCDDEGVIDCDLEPDHDNERWSDGFPNPWTFCGHVMMTMAQSD